MKIYPVIHYKDYETTQRNAQIAIKAGCDGVFLISMDGNDKPLAELAAEGKHWIPQLDWGINLLQHSALDSVKIAANYELDMVWSDNPIVTSLGITAEAQEVRDELLDTDLTFFASVAFKYQANESDPGKAAGLACSLGFIPTTSGTKTGQPPSILKIEDMINSYYSVKKLAIASGLSPKNIRSYYGRITHALVATGVSSDFHNFDPKLLGEFVQIVRELQHG